MLTVNQRGPHQNYHTLLRRQLHLGPPLPILLGRHIHLFLEILSSVSIAFPYETVILSSLHQNHRCIPLQQMVSSRLVP